MIELGALGMAQDPIFSCDFLPTIEAIKTNNCLRNSAIGIGAQRWNGNRNACQNRMLLRSNMAFQHQLAVA